MPAYRVKLRRGTSAEHANFVGAEGEVTVDTDKKRLVVHDGVTPGGFLIAALEDVKTDISEYTDSEGLMGGYTYDVQGTELPLTSTSPIVNYTVTVASGFRYNGRGIPGGPGDVFYLRNDTAGETEFTENPHITLQTGYTYIFDMSDASNIGHPLQFTTDMGQTAFTSGVTTQGTAGQAGATVTFTVPSPRPLNLMYYCGVHGAGMGGEITVGSDAYVAPVIVDSSNNNGPSWTIDSINLSTYDSVKLDLSPENPNINAWNGITFNDDGSKLFAANHNSDAIFQYNLSTSYDLSTATFAGSHQFLASNSNIYNNWSVLFNPDGSKLYIGGGSTIYQYNLGTNFDLSSSNSYIPDATFYGENPYPKGLKFNNDGTRLYTVGPGYETVNQYDLQTPYEISTATYNGVTMDLTILYGASDQASGLAFNSNGTKMFIAFDATERVAAFDLTVPFDIGTAYIQGTSEQQFILSSTEYGTGRPHGLEFSNDGTKMFVVDADEPSIYQFSTVTTTPVDQSDQWTISDISTSSDDNVTLDLSTESASPREVSFKPDGTKMYVIGSEKSVHEYDLSYAWDLSSATHSQSVDLVPIINPGVLTCITFKPDGTKMYIGEGLEIFECDLSTPWDISTATAVAGGTYETRAFDGLQSAKTQGITFSPDGLRLFYSNARDDAIVEIQLGTAWSISTAVYYGWNYDMQQIDPADTWNETSPAGLQFNSDGSRLYVTGQGVDSVHQIRLLNNYKVNTAVYEKSYSLGQGAKTFLAISSDGSKMYTNDSATIRQHTTNPSYGSTG